MTLTVKPELSTRNSDHTPLELLEEASEIVERLTAQYGQLLANNADIQHIVALLDGAIFKLHTVRERIRETAASASSAKEIPEGQVKEEPLTLTDMAKAVFGFLTADDNDDAT